MANVLADIFGYGNTLKRKVNGLLDDPRGSLEQFVGQLNDQMTQNNSNMDKAGWGLGKQPFVSVLADNRPSIGNGSAQAVTPQQREQAQAQVSSDAANAGLAAMVTPSYKGQHTAPMKGEGSAPLHDLAQIYPDDIYSSKASQYYGHYGDFRDNEAVRLMQAAKGKPNMQVTMYRAVPDLTADASKEMKAIRKTIEYKDKFGFFPMKDDLSSSFRAKYENSGLSYDEIQAKAYQDMLDKVSSLGESLKKPPPINNGDWVTLSKAYAKEHGESALNGSYKIVSKKVPARKLFTDANSIQEFGYDESGKISNQLLNILGGGAVGYGGYQLANEKGLLGK